MPSPAFETLKKKLRWAFTSKKRRQALLEKILEPAPLVPDVEALLHYAQATDKVDISFDPKLIGTLTLAQLNTQLQGKQAGKISIFLNPDVQGVDAFLSVAHELRHYWQNKVLGHGAAKRNMEERDPVMSLMTVRVKEADAYAFESDVKRRLSGAMDALEKLTREMTENGGGLTEDNKKTLKAHFNLVAANLRASSAPHMRRTFTQMLNYLQSYDKKQILRTHAYHTSPYALPTDFAHLGDDDRITPAKLKASLLAGVFQGAKNYMKDVSDAEFQKTVMAAVDPVIVKAATLMTAFDAAAAKKDTETMREIRRALADKALPYIRRLPARKAQ